MADDLLSRVRGEIDERLADLRPAVEEYERLLVAAEALTSEQRAPAPVARAKRTPRAKRAPTRVAKATAPRGTAPRGTAPRGTAPRGAAQQAIVAALEHGSHTVSELTVVTAMSGANIRDSLRRLLGTGTITRAKREGRAAYALSSAPAD